LHVGQEFLAAALHLQMDFMLSAFDLLENLPRIDF